MSEAPTVHSLNPYLADSGREFVTLDLLQKVVRPTDGPVLYLRVKNPGRFERDATFAEGGAAAVGALATPGATLFIDCSGEGPVFREGLAARFDALADATGIPQDRMVFLQTNAVFFRDFLESRTASAASKRVRDMFGHHYAIETFRTAINEGWPARGHANVEAPAEGRRIALCLNASPRGHRTMLAYLMAKRRRRDKVILTFRTEVQRKISADHARAMLRPFADAFSRDTDEVLETLANAPVHASAFEAAQSYDLAFSLEPELYEQTLLSVVTETEMSNGQVDRFSEKPLKAFAMGHPVIVFGNPFVMARLKALGFDTFDDILDLSFDTIVPRIHRFRKAVRAVDEALARPPGFWRSPEIKARLHANVALFEGTLARQFEDRVMGEARTLLDTINARTGATL
ncbi:MAG: hypothetical protein AAF318_11975 [Pseudomonadota bacterium]